MIDEEPLHRNVKASPTDPVMAWRLAKQFEMQQRVNAKGEQLFTLGYTVRKMAGCYLVSSKEGKKYIVDVLAGECTCPYYQNKGQDCKHLVGLAKLLEGAHTVLGNGEIIAAK